MSRRAERDSVIKRGRSAIAEARAIREDNRVTRKKADAIRKSASGSRLRSGGRSASIIHDLESASHELHILRSRIDSVIKHKELRPDARSADALQHQTKNKSHNITR